MYTGRLVVRVHYAYAEVYNWSLAAKTILKIAYNQSAMGFFFLAVIWSGYFKKYVLKTGQTFEKTWLRPTPKLTYPDQPDSSIPRKKRTKKNHSY